MSHFFGYYEALARYESCTYCLCIRWVVSCALLFCALSSFMTYFVCFTFVHALTSCGMLEARYQSFAERLQSLEMLGINTLIMVDIFFSNNSFFYFGYNFFVCIRKVQERLCCCHKIVKVHILSILYILLWTLITKLMLQNYRNYIEDRNIEINALGLLCKTYVVLIMQIG